MAGLFLSHGVREDGLQLVVVLLRTCTRSAVAPGPCTWCWRRTASWPGPGTTWWQCCGLLISQCTSIQQPGLYLCSCSVDLLCCVSGAWWSLPSLLSPWERSQVSCCFLCLYIWMTSGFRLFIFRSRLENLAFCSFPRKSSLLVYTIASRLWRLQTIESPKIKIYFFVFLYTYHY